VTAAGLRRTLLSALVLLALGGALLHYRVHPYLVPDPAAGGRYLLRTSFLAANLLPMVDLLLVTVLFLRRDTAPLAYLINGVLVIYGVVLMGHFSIAVLAPKAPTLADWLLKSTLADIALAAGDFLVGKALFESWMREA
jgi:hypothetical protein